MSGEVVGFGVRRKGTAAIVGIVPEKIAATPPKSDSYLRDFEEVPLVLATDLAALQAKLDAVTKDAERLDWLDSQREAYGFENEHLGNRWMIDGAYNNLRQAIDAGLALTDQGRAGEGRGDE